jgi:hypothetical protein
MKAGLEEVKVLVDVSLGKMECGLETGQEQMEVQVLTGLETLEASLEERGSWWSTR